MGRVCKPRGSGVGMESETEVGEKGAADGGGIEPEGTQGFFADSFGWVGIDLRLEFGGPRGEGFYGRELRGMTALAGTEALTRGEASGGEKEGIAGERAASRTRGAAEDAGGGDGEDEEAVEGDFASVDGAEQASARGERGEWREWWRFGGRGRGGKGWRSHERSVCSLEGRGE